MKLVVNVTHDLDVKTATEMLKHCLSKLAQCQSVAFADCNERWKDNHCNFRLKLRVESRALQGKLAVREKLVHTEVICPRTLSTKRFRYHLDAVRTAVSGAISRALFTHGHAVV